MKIKCFIDKKRFYYIMIFMIVFCIFNIRKADAAVPTDAKEWNGHYYKAYNMSYSWARAKNYCESLGGHLVTINSVEENEIVCQTVGETRKKWYWLGMHIINGDYQWITGENITYSNWADSEPDNYGGKQGYVYITTEAMGVYSVGAWGDGQEAGGSWDNYSYWDIDNAGFICEWDNRDQVPFVLKSVEYEYGLKKVDVLNTVYIIKNDHNPFSIHCNLDSQSEKPSRYELFVGKEKIAESKDGNFEGIDPSIIYPDDLELGAKDPGLTLSINMCGTKGEGCSTSTLLTIKKEEALHKYLGGSSLSLGDAIEFQLDKDVPLVGGQKFKLKLPDVPVNVVLEEGKIKVGVNIDKKDLYSYNSNEGVTTSDSSQKKDWKKRISDWKKDLEKEQYSKQRKSYILKDMKGYLSSKSAKADLPGFQEEISFSLIGYGEGTWSDSLETISVSLLAVLEGYDEFNHQIVWVVPITLQCKVSVNLSSGVELEWSLIDTENPISGTWNMKTDVALELYGGVGAGKMASGGVYGKAGIESEIVLLSTKEESGLKQVDLYGDAGVKGYFAMKEYRLPLLDTSQLQDTRFGNYVDSDGKLLVYSNDGSKVTILNPGGTGTKMAIADVLSADLESLYENPEMYFESADLVLSSSSSEMMNDGSEKWRSLISSAYGDARPTLITFGDKQILFYVGIDEDRAILDQTVLQYMVYDEENGCFSHPEKVDQDTTADYAPVVFSDGTDLYIAYLNANKLFTEDIGLEEYCGGFSIQVMKYAQEEEHFVSLGKLGTQDTYCYNISLTKTDEGLRVSWSENADNNTFGATALNNVYSAEYQNDSWDIRTVNTSVNCVTNLISVVWNGQEYIAYTIDGDGNLVTPDNCLYVKSSDGTECRYDLGKIQSLQFTELPSVSEKVLAWNNNGTIQYLTGFQGEVQTLVSGIMKASDPFKVDGNKIYFISSDLLGRNIYVAIYTNGKWGVIPVTEEKGFIDYFSFDQENLVYLSTMGIDEDYEVRSIIRNEKTDISLESIYVNHLEVQPSQKMIITAFIVNKGSTTQSELMAIIGSDSQIIPLESKLLPGDGVEVKIPYQLPETFSGEDYDLTICSVDADDVNISDNTLALGLSRTELEIDAGYYVTIDGNYVKAVIRNTSCIGTDAEIYILDNHRNELDRKNIWVAGNSSVEYIYDIDEALFAGDLNLTMTVCVDPSVEEYDDTNNKEGVRICKATPSVTTKVLPVTLLKDDNILKAHIAEAEIDIVEHGFLYGTDDNLTLLTPGRSRIMYTECDENGNYILKSNNSGSYVAYAIYSDGDIFYSSTVKVQ